ncbi:MAG: hypothetical protein IH944_10675 [Armatimonadetes bacterium]|nr:hypothetical protein [Armatimonadota bacterium]
MKFFVLSTGGQKFGPADIPTLNKWITEKRITPETDLENADTKQIVKAGTVAGLVFGPTATGPGASIIKDPVPASRPTLMDSPGASPQNPYQGQPQNPYQNPPAPGSSYPRQGVSHLDDGTPAMIKNAWILIIVGFLCAPLILYPFAIYQANRAKRMNNPNAQAPLIIAWILLGLNLAVVLFVVVSFVVGMSQGF